MAGAVVAGNKEAPRQTRAAITALAVLGMMENLEKSGSQ